VAEPSLHPDTKRPYSWDVDHHPDDVDIADAPDWLVEHLGNAKAPSHSKATTTPHLPPDDPFIAFGQAAGAPENDPRISLQQACEAIATAPIGEQEAMLNTNALCMARFVAAGQLKLEEVAVALVSAGLKMANQEGREPWTRQKLEAKVMHGLSDGMVDNGIEDAPQLNGGEAPKQAARPLPPSIADFPANRWDGQEIQPPEFVIGDLAPRRRLVNVAGVGGAGKGILMQTAATSIAAGLPFLGKDTLQGPVAYYSCEDEDAVLHHRQARINALLGLETTPANLFIKSYLGHNLTMFNGTKWTPLFEWLWNDIDKIEGRIAAVIDPASEVFLGDFLNPVAVKTFCRRFDIEAAKRNMVAFMLMHTAKGGDTAKTPFGSVQWLNAARATLMLEPAIGEDGRPNTDEAALRVAKGNFVKPGEEIPLLWTDDGLLVRKDEPDAYERLSQLKELTRLITELVDAAWKSAAPLSDNRTIADRYLPARVVQASNGKFTRKEAQEQTSELLRLGQLELTQHHRSRRLGLRITNQKSQKRGEHDT
jgi:hypothetical protein